MAKWVYIRGFSNLPYDTRTYTACANNFITNVQSVCGLTVDNIDFFTANGVIYECITYTAVSAIPMTSVFPY